MEKSVASASRRPFTSAWTKEPVRMRPGTIVVTRIPCRSTSLARPVENPSVANFALE